MLERLTEIGLFLLPFVLFGLWRLAATRGWPSNLVLGWAGGGLLVLLAGLLWYAHTHRLPPTDAYVPARLSDGRVLSGHGAP